MLYTLAYFLDSIYKSSHAVCVFLCLTYFNWPSIVWLHPCCCRWQNLFLLYGRMCRLVVHRSWKSAGVPFDCFCLLTERQSGSSTQSERRRRFWTLREDKVRKETRDAERVRALGRLSALMVSRGLRTHVRIVTVNLR